MKKKRGGKIGPDAEPGLSLRVVTLMDCVPGNQKTPDGPPISILTLASKDEIEPPMMLSFEDTKRLWVKCTESLASGNDEFAKYLLEQYLPANGENDQAGPKSDDDDDPSEAWKKA